MSNRKSLSAQQVLEMMKKPGVLHAHEMAALDITSCSFRGHVDTSGTAPIWQGAPGGYGGPFVGVYVANSSITDAGPCIRLSFLPEQNPSSRVALILAKHYDPGSPSRTEHHETVRLESTDTLLFGVSGEQGGSPERKLAQHLGKEITIVPETGDIFPGKLPIQEAPERVLLPHMLGFATDGPGIALFGPDVCASGPEEASINQLLGLNPCLFPTVLSKTEGLHDRKWTRNAEDEHETLWHVAMFRRREALRLPPDSLFPRTVIVRAPDIRSLQPVSKRVQEGLHYAREIVESRGHRGPCLSGDTSVKTGLLFPNVSSAKEAGELMQLLRSSVQGARNTFSQSGVMVETMSLAMEARELAKVPGLAVAVIGLGDLTGDYFQIERGHATSTGEDVWTRLHPDVLALAKEAAFILGQGPLGALGGGLFARASVKTGEPDQDIHCGPPIERSLVHATMHGHPRRYDSRCAWKANP